MKNTLVKVWRKARGYVAALSCLVLGSSALAEGESSPYAPDFTEATSAITAVSDGIVTWIKSTVMGKVIAVSVVFVVLALVVKVIRYFARGK